ncbi:MAG: tetratricopeptide repeat protein [Anaerolineae bacterium]|nr:tetratricopeptide repeat protein [Anaerolineae bacterium]
MSDTVFVGREAELARLTAHLDKALAGKGQIVFISGEAGSGKSALMAEFARNAQMSHPDLIIGQGTCNAQTGMGEAYLPFREILGVLTGNLETSLVERGIAAENTDRVRKLLARSGLLLIDIAPDLIKLVPVAGSVISPLSKAVLKQAGVDKRLGQVIEQKHDLLELTDQAVSQEHIFEQCYNFLVKLAEFQPLLITLDDLQWADASSVSLLFYLGRRLTDQRIMLVGNFRPDEIAAGRSGGRHPTEQLYTELMRVHGDIVVDLTGFDPVEARKFVDAYLDTEPNRFSADFRAALTRHTRGHPLFIVELVSDLQERGLLAKDEEGRWMEPEALDWTRLPARIDGVIRSRVDRLESGDRATLTTASVSGEDFIAEVVATLQGAPNREVVQRLSSDLSRRHQLVEAREMQRIGGQRISHYGFRHQLIQQFLYGELDNVERAYLHEDTATALETLYQESPDDIVVALAWHYEMAGVTAKAAHYARLAGELAASRHANDEAIEHFNRALALLPTQDMSDRLELLLAREAIYGWQGNRAAQANDLDALATIAGALNNPGAQARVELRRANLARLTSNIAIALETVQRAVSLAERAGNALLEARGYALLGRILLQTGKDGEAREWLELANEIAREEGDLRLQALSLYDLGHTYFGSTQLTEAAQRYLEAQALFEAVPDRRGIANCLLMLGAVQRQTGNHDDALRFYDQALATCRTLGWRHGESYVLSNLGNTYFTLGDFVQAGENHRDALSIRRDVADRQGEALNLDTLGLVAQFQGVALDARSLYEEALAIQRSLDDLRGLAYTLTHLGLLAEETGDLAAAETAQRDALAIRDRRLSRSSAAIDNLAGLARIAQARGDLPEAQRLAELVEEMLAEKGVAGVEFPALAYLTVFQVLNEVGQHDAGAATRAETILHEGQAIVRAQADKLDDPAMRSMYLQYGPYNRQLLSA